MEHLTRRERILKYIVEEFIKTANPIGSHTLINQYKLPYSSATVRNEMLALEIDGFLEMINMTPVCTYENISVEKIIEKVDSFMQNKNVNYTEKTEEFSKMGRDVLDKIIAELDKK